MRWGRWWAGLLLIGACWMGGCAASQREARVERGQAADVEAECPKCGAQFKIMTWKGI